MSTERLIVAEAIADRLIRRIEDRRRALVVGDPARGAVDLGPVIDIAAAERQSALVDDALSKGATLVGRRPSRWPMTANTASRRRCSRPICSAPNPSRGGCIRASATSTAAR